MQVPMTPQALTAQDGHLVQIHVSGKDSKFIFNFRQHPRSHPYGRPVHVMHNIHVAPDVGASFSFSGGFPHPGGGPPAASPAGAAPAFAAPTFEAQPAAATAAQSVATDPSNRAAVPGEQVLAAVPPPPAPALVAGMGDTQPAAAGDENHKAVDVREDGGDSLAGTAQTVGTSHKDHTELAPDAKTREMDFCLDCEGGEEEEPEVDEEGDEGEKEMGAATTTL